MLHEPSPTLPHRPLHAAARGPRPRLAGLGRGLALALALGTGPAAAVAPLKTLDVVLLQPGPVLERRIEAPDAVEAMARWVQATQTAAEQVLAAHPQQLPVSGFIVPAARPDGTRHAWLDFRPALAPTTAQALEAAVAAVPAPALRGGPVVFALRVSVWGARSPASWAPSPPAWRQAAQAAGHALALDELLTVCWPPGDAQDRPAVAAGSVASGAAP